MKKLLSVILSVAMLCSTAVFVSADESLSAGEMSETKTVRVGIDAEYEPFEYYENGELTGFDVDLMNMIISRTGYVVEYIDMPFDELILAVANGDVDCAVSAITATEERNEIVDFSRNYLMCSMYETDDAGTTEYQEKYAIAFREGVSNVKYLSRTPNEYEEMYMAIDDAIGMLLKDGTIDSLILKYELDKPIEYDGNVVQFKAVDDNNDKISATSVPASEWATESVEKARKIGITNYGGNYNYPGNITREEFCELIYNYYKLIPDGIKTVEPKNSFTDTDNGHIAVLNSLGIIKGKSDTEFAPNDLLTREEAATIIFRLIKTVHPDWAATELWFDFVDEGDISDWSMDAIQRICNMGIMKGVGDSKFAPKANFTTEQAVATMVRCYENFNRSEIIGGSDEKTDIVVSDLSFADKMNVQMPTDKNYMFSPLSIKMALAMSANGADGNTKSEILAALGIDNIDDFNALSKDIIERYSKTDILNLNIANSIWMNKDKTTQNFSTAFKKTATDYYNADVKTVNNKNAVSEINSWVSDKTNGKITEIVQNTDDFWSMLVNAIYFKGAWQNEFNESATKPDEFTSADGTKTQIDFMNKTAWMNYAETKSSKMVELPYKNRLDKFDKNGEYIDTERYDDLDVAMYVITSDEDINVAEELEAAIDDKEFKSTYIKLSMPKFRIEYSQDLNDMLKNIGINTAFEPGKAEFGKMFDSGNMWFTKTIHKTFIDVDEKGTEAAAVTAIGMAGSAMPPEPIELKFNKPFHFVICDNTSGEILFMGRYAFAE